MTIEDRINEIEGRLTNILRVVDAEIARVENKYKKLISGATLVRPPKTQSVQFRSACTKFNRRLYDHRG